MNKNIGLQICSNNGSEWNSLLSIDWQGPVLSHFQPLQTYYPDYVFAVELLESADIYEIDLCKVSAPDGRVQGMRVALCVPHGYTTADSNGNNVSPAEVLLKIYGVLITKVLSLSFGQYDYRWNVSGSKVSLQPDDYAAILSDYRAVPMWGKEIVMPTKGPAALIAASDAEAAALIPVLPRISRMADYQRIELGEFKAGAPILALTSEEKAMKAEVSLKVWCSNNTFKTFALLNPQTINSEDFGYDKSIYNNVAVGISPIDVFEAFREGQSSMPLAPDCTVTLQPREGTVTMKFSPQERIVTFPINVTGGPADTVISQLTFKSQPISNGHILRKGAEIGTFKALSSQQLKEAFSLNIDSQYELESVTMAAEQINIVVKKKPRPIQEPTPAPAPKPGAKPKPGKQPVAEASGASGSLTPLEVTIAENVKLDGNIAIAVIQKSEDYTARTEFSATIQKGKGKKTATGQFPLMPGNDIKVEVGSPAEYSVKANQSSEDRKTYKVTIDEGTEKTPLLKYACKLKAVRWGAAILAALALFGAGCAVGFYVIPNLVETSTQTEQTAPAANNAAGAAASDAVDSANQQNGQSSKTDSDTANSNTTPNDSTGTAITQTDENKQESAPSENETDKVPTEKTPKE